MYEHAIMSNFKQWEHFSEKETKQDERYVQFFGKR